MSFRLKTILGIAAIEAALLFILVASSLTILRTSNEDELMTRLYTTAKLFATTTKDAVLATDLAALESVVEEVMTNRGMIYARVVDANGRVLAQGGQTQALARPFVADRSIKDEDPILDGDADIEVAGVKYGRVEIGISTAQLEEVLMAARERTIAIAALGMTLVVLFSAMLGLYLTRSLSTLRAAAERIAEGRFGYQVPAKGGDELAQTAEAFNSMSRKLAAMRDERQAAEAAIVQLNQDLERRVAQRTRELAMANQELAHQALHDALTQIPNRRLLVDRLQQALLIAGRERRGLALIIIDVDNFKEINDGIGHHGGDQVLQAVAQRLKSVLRRSDTVARLGGDEFAAVLPGINSEAVAVAVAEKMIAALGTPLMLDNRALGIGASLGIAIYPQHGDEVGVLLRHADAAMYAAKRDRAGYVMYSSALDAIAAERTALQSELRAAIERDELVLHYQPKVDLRLGRATGVEALVRWRHPARGLLYPDHFIPFAEASGLIKPLTDWVLRQALTQLKAWRASGLELNMAVNVSAANLQDGEFPGAVAQVLEEKGVAAQWVEFEITETAIMLDPARAVETVKRLGALGLRLSIDDFGTGYSSMGYLRKLPMAQIKIDKSFVMEMRENPNDLIIVRSIIGLGHSLGLEVVAEGVENEETLRELKALGCDVAQGYGMSRPIPPEALEEWLKVSRWAGNWLPFFEQRQRKPSR